MTESTHSQVRLVHIRGNDRLYRGMKDCFGFVVVREGWVSFSHGTASPRLEGAGGVLMVRPGEVYCERARAPHSELDFLLVPRETLEQRRASDEAILRLGRSDPRRAAVVRLVEAVRTSSDALAVETVTCELARAAAAAEAARDEPRSREREAVRRARDLLLDRFRENIRLDELAEHSRLDKYHLVRAFRARHGVPPYEYLTHARIVMARRLLLRGRRPSDVAAEVGYCDQSQLHRHFVRIVGTTPGRYRNRA